jgi:hypothetical protein
MKLTNKYSVPQMLVDAISKGHWYSGESEKRDYSVTEILNPTKLILLNKRHYHEVEEDVIDSIYKLLGSAVHLVLERAVLDSAKQQMIYRMRDFAQKAEKLKNASDEDIKALFRNIVVNDNNGKHIIDLVRSINDEYDFVEKRFKYVTKSGKIISGGTDHYSSKNKCITDYKLTPIWSWIYRNRTGSKIEEWTKQLNMYRLFLENAGYEVNRLQTVAIFRDYSKTDASRERNYPNPVEVIEIPLLGLDVVEQMIENKIAEIEKYTNYSDDDIPICEPKDRWQGKDSYAVMKKGNKRASKVEYSYAAAKSMVDVEIQKIAEKEIQGGKDAANAYKKASAMFNIEKRTAKPTRCISYCPVNKFCNFYKSLPSELK